MHINYQINYQEWGRSKITIRYGGKTYVVAPEDLTMPDDASTRSGFFDQEQAIQVDRDLACCWTIPSYEQMLEMVKKCDDMKNNHSYWIDGAKRAYNPTLGRSTPQVEIDSGLLSSCRIRPICDLASLME